MTPIEKARPEMTPRRVAEEIAGRHFDACDCDDKLSLDEARQLRVALADAIEKALHDQIEAMRKRKDAAYEERNKVVAALARLFPSGTARTSIEGWSDDWHGCVYIDLPTGQVSWHFHDSQAHLFDGLPPYAGKWDGHDTDEKYKRLSAIRAMKGPKP